MSFKIEPVSSAADLEAVSDLFRAYVASLGIDLAYQGFEQELATLPGKYAPPAGALLIAKNLEEEPVGCVALRPLSSEICEMKRLYVDPAGRGLGLGRALTEAIIAEAIRIGYREMRLDTLPTLTAAAELYRKTGFVPIPAYYDTPIEGTLFMALSLLS